MNNSVLIIGIGNKYRSDDAVGLQIADSISKAGIDSCKVLTTSGEGIALLNMWEGFDNVILLDAVKSDNKAGEIYRIDLAVEKLEFDWFRASSHLFSVPEAVKLAVQLGKLPPSIVFFGIEGASFEYGDRMTPAVVKASHKILPMIINEIHSQLLLIQPT